MWKQHYSDLLNSSTDTSKKAQVCNNLLDISDFSEHHFNPIDVDAAVRKLKKGKSLGLDDIASEHFLYASKKVLVYLSLIFNAMLVHGHIPNRIMDTMLISLVKDKKGTITDKDNYRPIAITCASSKILELIILDKFGNFFETNSHQFGFKQGHSTDLCIFTMKEVINYYGLLSSPVYACYIDASKAFDRVNHWHLFDKLLDRNVPKCIVRLLMIWYTSQTFIVRWGPVYSDHFTVRNGVRQGVYYQF